MKRLKRKIAFLGMGLCLLLSGCSSSQTDEKTTKTETETLDAVIPSSWQEQTAAGFSMMLPADMCAFENYGDGIYLSLDDTGNSVLMIRIDDGAVLEPSDISESDMKDLLLDTYDAVEVLDFDNSCLVGEEYPAVFVHAAVTDNDEGEGLEVMMYLVIPGDGSMAVIDATVVDGSGTALEGRLDSWKASLAIADAEQTASAWRSVSVGGFTMEIPADMEDFVLADDDLYMSVDESENAAIMVAQSDGAEIDAADITQDQFESLILNTYSELDVIEFDNSARVSKTVPACYLYGNAVNSQDQTVQLMLYLVLPGNGTQTMILASAAEGKGMELEDNLERWRDSLAMDSSSSGSTASQSEKDLVKDVSGALNTKDNSSSASSPGASSSSAGSSASGSSNPVAGSEYVAYNQYFYVQVPESWADTLITKQWASSDGEAYYFKLSEPTSNAALEDGGGLVTFALLPQSWDWENYPSVDYLGIMTIDGTKYNVIAMYPTDAGFTPETEAAYREWDSQVYNVVATFAPMEGYTFEPADF